MCEQNPSKKTQAVDAEPRDVLNIDDPRVERGDVDRFANKSVVPAQTQRGEPVPANETRAQRPNAARRGKRPGEVDPHIDERIRDKRLESAKIFLFLCGLSTVVAVVEWDRGIVRFGWSLSVASTWGIAALVTAEQAGKTIPRWQRWLAYGMTTIAVGIVIGAMVSKALR